MKKPKIEVKGTFTPTIEGMNAGQLCRAYEEMMDALIKMRSVWYNECWERAYGTSSGNEKEADKFAKNEKYIKMMDEALKKAGVEL